MEIVLRFGSTSAFFLELECNVAAQIRLQVLVGFAMASLQQFRAGTLNLSIKHEEIMGSAFIGWAMKPKREY